MKEDTKVIYTDGVWDLMHHGHYNLLKQAKEMGDKLVVGVMSDELMERDKRLPIMSMKERGEILLHCKYVDEIVLDPPDPPDIDDEFLKKYSITYVVHSFPDNEKWKISKEYAHLIEKDKFRQLKRTEGISTTNLIERVRERPTHVPQYSRRDINTFIDRYEYTAKSYAKMYKTTFVKGNGLYVWDIDNKKYVDCLNGFGVNILGHNPPCLQNALREYINTNPIWQGLDLMTPEHIDFVETLFKLLPEKIRNHKICFIGPTGSEAVEMAIKLARQQTKRFGIFAFAGCFHGSTIGANTLTGNRHDQSMGSLSHVYHMPFPRVKDIDCPFGKGNDESVELCLKYVRNLLLDKKGGTDIPAAMIIEPVQSDGGIIPTPVKFLEGLYELCTEFNILFISDEIQTGFGKTGNLFGYQLANIVPDIITCSKSWGGSLPLSFVLYSNKIKGLPHSGTFRGNQIAFKLGYFFMNYFQEHNILDNVKKIERFWLDRHDRILELTSIHEFRVCGSLLGLEFNTRELCDKAFSSFLNNGLLVKQGGRDYKTLILWCMLNLDTDDLQEIYDIFIKSLINLDTYDL